MARFGRRGGFSIQIARGIDPLNAEPPGSSAALLSGGMDLEWPIVAVEPFLFVARACRREAADRPPRFPRARVRARLEVFPP